MITHVAIRKNKLELLDAGRSSFVVSENIYELANFMSACGGVAEDVYLAPSFKKPEAFGCDNSEHVLELFSKARKMAA